MIPRGGGAFLNEVDGNLACIKKGDITLIYQHGKYRDVDFPAIPFQRSVKYSERLKTTSGKRIPTVIAHFSDEQIFAEAECQMKAEDMQVLADAETMSTREMAKNNSFGF